MSLSDRAARYLGSVRPNDVTQRRKKTSSMTITLVALSVIFFLTTSPICVYNVIEHYVEDGVADDPRGTGRLRLAWAVVNILMYTNSALNFYLYCLSGARFRQELRRCLCCHLSGSRSWFVSSKNLDGHTATNNNSNNNHNHDNHLHRGQLAPNDQGNRRSDGGDGANSVSLNVHNRTLQSVVLGPNHDASTEF